ncbi:hypothetical protein Prudu_1250S000100, partial [Prunus dulcis]
DELQKQVSEGKVRVDGSKDVLTMALGPEHPGQIERSSAEFPQARVSFDDRLKESLKVLLQEETKKMEAKAKEEALRMEARTKQLVEAERSISLQEKKKEEEKRDEEKEEEKEKKDEESMTTSLCRYVETTLLPEDKILEFTIDKEVFGGDRETFLLPEDTQFAGMEEIVELLWFAVYMRHLHDPSLDLTDCKSKKGDRLFSGSSARSTCGRRGGEKPIVNSAIKIYNTHIARIGRKNVIWKTLSGTPKQPSSVECGVLRYALHEGHYHGSFLGFENKYAKGNQEASYPQEAIDEVRNEWAETVFQFIK